MQIDMIPWKGIWQQKCTEALDSANPLLSIYPSIDSVFLPLSSLPATSPLFTAYVIVIADSHLSCVYHSRLPLCFPFLTSLVRRVVTAGVKAELTEALRSQGNPWYPAVIPVPQNVFMFIF